MAKKKIKPIFMVGIIALVLILGGVIAYFGITQQSIVGSKSTTLYCNDYSFTCCADKNLAPITKTFVNKRVDYYQCPASADYCMVTLNAGDSPNFFEIGSGATCHTYSNILGSYFHCDGFRTATTNSIRLEPSEYIYTNTGGWTPTITIVVNSQNLYFSGRAGTGTGVLISTGKCTFVTDKTIYAENGELIKQPSAGSISYVVPEDSCILGYVKGDRHDCGNTEESCSIATENVDCGGHTYGNYECIGRTLQKYGCEEYGTVPTQSQLDLSLTTGETFSYGHRCEIASAKQVLCCGDTDCGSNAVCDNNPSSKTAWTCVAPSEVSCRQNSDCGVSQQCNIATKEIVKPVCTLGKCGYSTVKSVECCSPNDCAINSYCDSDNKCKENPMTKTACPSGYECCPVERAYNEQMSILDSQNYFNKPCPNGLRCDANHVCTTTPPPPPEPECKAFLGILPDVPCLLSNWLADLFQPLIIGFAILSAILSLLLVSDFTNSRKMFEKQKIIGWILAIAVAGIVGYLVYLYFWLGVVVILAYIIFKTVMKSVI